MLTYCTRLKFNNEQSLEVFVEGLEKMYQIVFEKSSLFLLKIFSDENKKRENYV